LSRLESYVFTDISLPFISGTKQQITKAYPAVKARWQYLDINKPFSRQKFRAESFDLIYGVNAAHVARDTVGFLRECRTTLRRGGKAVFAERIRRTQEMAPRELTLNLSIYHRTAAVRSAVCRPMHAYLAPEHWLRVLDLAGFNKARVLPRVDALSDSFPSQYAAVVVAEK
jgi:SAM-dependent methyltransferase